MTPNSNFASDNVVGLCPEALDALHRANQGTCPSYGEDEWTREAADAFRLLFGCDCDVYFVATGTAANALALASLCASYHAVIAHELAHIETDECGAPEFYSNGSKLLTLSGPDAKLAPDAVRALATRRQDLHAPKPRALSLSQATECGTVYTPAELRALCSTARDLGLRVHMDGARFANAVAHLNLSPADITCNLGIDVLCFSGTKNGLGMGEAILFFDRSLSEDFAWRCKQSGHLLSKMRFLSAPWLAVLESGAWLHHARHANRMALLLRQGLSEIPGITFAHPTEANGVFVNLPDAASAALRARGWRFYSFIGRGFARFMCSWKTQPADIEQLLRDVRSVC